MELVEGYGVYISKRQLDEAVDQSCKSPTRLIRNLLTVFFTPSIMAQSSCFGTRKYSKLNSDIIGACFSESIVPLLYLPVFMCMSFCLEFVQSRHDVGRSLLVDCVNDKCANYRRKAKPVKVNGNYNHASII